MRSRVILPAVLACLSFGPSPAQALTLSEYAVTIEGSGDYYRHDAQGAGTFERQAKLTWRTTIPSVTFVGKELGDTSPARISTGVAEARDDLVLPTPTGTFAGFCKGGRTAVRAGQLGRALVPAGDGREGLDIRVLGGVEIELRDCGGDKVVSPTTLVLGNGHQQLGSGAFDVSVEMPHEAIGMGKVIELVGGGATGRQCPQWTNATVTCTLRWKATVTLDRIRQQELGAHGSPEGPDVVVEPPPPPPPPPRDIGPLPLEPHDPGTGEPLARGRLTSSGATVTIACPAGCTGTATATNRGRRLARSRFTVLAGRPKQVRLRFRRRRSGPVRVTVATGGERTVLTLRGRDSQRPAGRSR